MVGMRPFQVFLTGLFVVVSAVVLMNVVNTSTINGSITFLRNLGYSVFAAGEGPATPATFVVCASNANNTERCDYLADGVADQVTIATAESSAPSSGASIYLSDGTFNISASSTIGTLNNVIIANGGTRIKPASGIQVTFASIDAPATQIFDISAGGTIVLTYEIAIRGVYPEWWGANATDSVDDLAAFQAAIDSRPDRSAVVLPTIGIYTLSNSLKLGNATQIIGVGALMLGQDNDHDGVDTIFYNPQTILDFSGQAVDGIINPIEVVDYRTHHILIKDVTILGSGRGDGKAGILLQTNTSGTSELTHVGLATIENVAIEEWGICIDLNDEADSTWITHVHFQRCNTGVYGGKTQTYISKSVFWQIYTTAIELGGPGGVGMHQIWNNEIEPRNSTTNGVVLGVTANDTMISNNTFGTSHEFSIDGATALSIYSDENTITGNTFEGTWNNFAILVGHGNNGYISDNNVISGNSIDMFGETAGSGDDGIAISLGSNNVIIGNVIFNPGANADSGIKVAQSGTGSATSTLIVGNIISGSYQETGIVVEAGANRTTVIANDLNPVTNSPKLTNAGTSSVIRDNRGFATESNGVATVTNGNTSIAVNHGLNVTPTAGDCIISASNSMGNATKSFISTYTSTQFTITVDADPGATTATFVWACAIQ